MMAAFIQWLSIRRKLRDAKHDVCAVSRRYPFDVQVPAMAVGFIEFSDNSALPGLDTELSDDSRCQVAWAQDLMKKVPASQRAERIWLSMSMADASISKALRLAENWSSNPTKT